MRQKHSTGLGAFGGAGHRRVHPHQHRLPGRPHARTNDQFQRRRHGQSCSRPGRDDGGKCA